MKCGAPIASRTALVRIKGPQEAAAKELIGVEPRLDLRIEDISSRCGIEELRTVPGGHRDPQYAAGRGTRAGEVAGRRRCASRRDDRQQAAKNQSRPPSCRQGLGAPTFHASPPIPIGRQPRSRRLCRRRISTAVVSRWCSGQCERPCLSRLAQSIQWIAKPRLRSGPPSESRPASWLLDRYGPRDSPTRSPPRPHPDQPRWPSELREGQSSVSPETSSDRCETPCHPPRWPPI